MMLLSSSIKAMAYILGVTFVSGRMGGCEYIHVQIFHVLAWLSLCALCACVLMFLVCVYVA